MSARAAQIVYESILARTGFFHPQLQSESSTSSTACSSQRNLTPDDQTAVDNSMVMSFPVDSTLNVLLPQ